MLRAILQRSSVPLEVRGQASTWGTWAGDDKTVVSESSALRLLAVTGSVQLLTESVSTLPVDVFRYSGVRRTEVTPPMWLKAPVVGLSFTDWCTQIMTSLLLHGNAYLVVTRGSDGKVSEVVPVPPESVSVKRANGFGGRLMYTVNGAPFTGEMLHIKGMMLPGADVGVSPLEFARQSIQLGLSAQSYGLESFDDSLNMPGVIEFPGSVDPAKMVETARLWQRSRRKGGRGLPGVLEGGGSFKATATTNEAAQFLETRQWTAAEICAQVYLIDPRELGIPITGTAIEYSNSESRMANLVRKGMLRWITRIEEAVSSLLPQPQYMKMNVDAMLRGTAADRWSIYKTASEINTAAAASGQPPVLLTDEMRAWEELDPLPYRPQVDMVVNSNVDDLAELRSLIHGLERTPTPVPINVSVDARQEPPVVNVDNRQEPTVVNVDNRMDAPMPPQVTVNVEPTPVTIDNRVDVSPTPVTVTNDVTAPPATVNVEIPRTRHTVRRDAAGNIVEVVEEPAG